jgi:hypothetical protein
MEARAESEREAPAPPTFYHPPPTDELGEPFSPPPFEERNLRAIARRRECEEQRAEKQREAEAKETEDSVLHRWFRPGRTNRPPEPIVGPAPKIRPGSPSISLSRSPPVKRSEPPQHSIPASPDPDFEAFLKRQHKPRPSRHAPPPPAGFCSPRSKQIIAQSPDHGMRRRGNSPDEGARVQARPTRPPADFAELQIALYNARRMEMADEAKVREVADCTWRPSFGNVERRDRLAKRSATRSRETTSVSVEPEEHSEEEDFQAIGEKNKKERQKHNERWKKSMFRVPFEREYKYAARDRDAALKKSPKSRS